MKNVTRYLILLSALIAAVVICFTVVHFFHLPPLSVFKYASLFVASASTVWGLMHELYTKDDSGKRQLLPEGKISIAVTIIALLCSAIGSIADDVTKHNADVKKTSNDKIKEARHEEEIYDLKTQLVATQNNTKRILLDQKVLKAITQQNGSAQKLGNESIRLQNKYENELNRRQTKDELAAERQSEAVVQMRLAEAERKIAVKQQEDAKARLIMQKSAVAYRLSQLPRTLAAAQQLDLFKALKQDAGSHVNIEATLGDAESLSFARQIDSSLKLAGWETNGIDQAIFKEPQSGLTVLVHSAQTAPVCATDLIKSLRSVGWEVQGYQNSTIPEGTVELIVGIKPGQTVQQK
jgi:hypothetical protein